MSKKKFKAVILVAVLAALLSPVVFSSGQQDTISSEAKIVDFELTAKASDVLEKNGSEVKPAQKKSIKLGLVPPVSVLYHETVKKGVEEAIASLPDGYDVELLYQMPTSTGQAATNEQINIIELWVSRGDVDAIVVCPVADDAALEPVFKMAADKGVAVIEYGVDPTMIKNMYLTSLVAYSQFDSAKAVGEWVAENYKGQELNIGFVSGPKGPYTNLRGEGFKAGLASHADYNVVAEQSGDWIREKAVNVTENMLTSHPEINLFFCMYDEMAMGAASAVNNRGLQDKVDIVGYDMNIESLQAVKDGTLTCSVYNGTKEAGQDVVKAAKMLLMDGEELGKSYMFPPMVVSGANVNDFDESVLKLR